MRPDLAGKLPDERNCIPLPEKVAGLNTQWSGALLDPDRDDTADKNNSNSEAWPGLVIKWRDWRETVFDAICDLEKVTRTLERSGWEELFDDDENGTVPDELSNLDVVDVSDG